MLDKFRYRKPNLDPEYFDSFKKTLSDKLMDEDMIDVAQDAPILSSLKKQTGMRLPDDYFSQTNFAELAKRKSRIIQWPQMLSIAASLIILFVAVFLISDTSSPEQSQLSMETLDEEEAYLTLIQDEAYLEEIIPDQIIGFDQQLESVELEEIIEANLDDFDFTDLAELL